MDFDTLVTRLIDREGGYVNDPADAGGETKYGIAKRYHPEVDIANLTIEGAKEIYFAKYWTPGQCEKVPGRLRETYFDMTVNPGITTAVRISQMAINSRVSSKIAVDGILGPITLGGMAYLEPDRLRAYRTRYYVVTMLGIPYSKRFTLMKKDRFWFGWYRRAISV